MEEKKQIKVSLGTVFLVIAIILIVVMGALLYMQKTEADRQIAELENNASKLQETIDDLQEKIDNVSNIVSDTKNENIKVEIPEASTNISDKEEKIIDYFKGIWTTDNGEKILAIDYGKRFCDINKSNNSKEYGTYTVKDGTSSSVATITLTYTSGKILELELTQGSANYLMSNDRKLQYVEYEDYYFGAGEGDEGIFSKTTLQTEDNNNEIYENLSNKYSIEKIIICTPNTTSYDFNTKEWISNDSAKYYVATDKDKKLCIVDKEKNLVKKFDIVITDSITSAYVAEGDNTLTILQKDATAYDINITNFTYTQYQYADGGL